MYLTQNTKMRKISGVKTYNWGIPAFRDRAGFVTCPTAGACKEGCFARGGWYTHRPVVLAAYERRLSLTRRPEFVETITAEIAKRKVARLRIHDAGDFYSPGYLGDWIRIMLDCPDTEFYTYSKRVAMLKLYAEQGALPENFSVVFSYGGKEDYLINPEMDRHCRVFESVAELRRRGYVDASDDDSVAVSSRNHRIGIVYHGQKHWRNTLWPSVNNV